MLDIGRVLEMTYNTETDLPVLVRNGKARQWDKELGLYKPVGAAGPVGLGWKTGTLEVRAGGHTFTQTVTKDGKVTFTEN